MPSRLALPGVRSRRFPVETPLVQSTPEILTQNHVARSWKPPFAPRCMSKSPSDSAGVGQGCGKSNPATALTERTARIRIIGIDPGLRRTGWGVIDYDGVRLGFVACGSVESDQGESLGVRLRQLFDGLAAGAGPARADGGRNRADLRQSRCRRHAEARPGAGHRHAGAGAARAADRRICAERGEEDRGRRRPRRQGSDPRHGHIFCRAQSSTARTRPTRSPSPSRMRMGARSRGWRRCVAERGTRHDRQAHRKARRRLAQCRDPRCRRRRLRGDGRRAHTARCRRSARA